MNGMATTTREEARMMSDETKERVEALVMEAATLVAHSLEHDDTGTGYVTRAMVVFEYMDADGTRTMGWHREPGFTPNDLSMVGRTLENASLVYWIEHQMEKMVRRVIREQDED